MASFSIESVTHDTVTISLSGLTYGDEVRVFIRLADDPDDTTKDVTGTYTGSSLMQFTGLEADTEYAINVQINGSDWIGAQTFWTDAVTGTRPDDWEWYSTIEQGAEFSLTAEEWNDFCDRINEFRVYVGLSEYSFTTVRSGHSIEASYMRQAISAINDIDGHGTLPAAVNAGNQIKASFFTKLASALNAV